MREYLSRKGVQFTEVDLHENPGAVQELIHKYNSRSTPTLVWAGRVLIGFDPEAIDALAQ